MLLRELARPRIVRDTIWVGCGQVVTALARLAALRVLTGLLPTAVYGRMALLQGFLVLGTTVFLWPSLQAILRFYPDAAREGRVDSLRGIAARTLWGSGAFAAVVLVVTSWLWFASSDEPVRPLVLALLLWVLYTEIARTFETNLLSASRRQLRWAAWTAVDACARPLFAVAAIAALGPTLEAVFLGYALGGTATNLAFSRVAVRSGAPASGAEDDPWVRDTRKEFFRYAVPLAALALPAWIYISGDRYILGVLYGDASVGPYAAVYALGTTPIAFLAGIGQTAFRPVFFQAVADGERPKERRVLLGWLLGFGATSLAGAALLGALAPFLVRIALGPAFRVAQDLLPWIAAAAAIQVFQQILETVLYAHRRTSRVLLLQVLSAAVALALYLALIPRMEARGAAIATFWAAVCSAALALAAAAAQYRRRPVVAPS